MFMEYTVCFSITDSGNFDTIIGFQTIEGMGITEHILRTTGVTLSMPTAERHMVALLQDTSPVVVDLACLFQALLFEKVGLTIQEVAETLGISDDLVRDLLDSGDIVGWRVKRRIVVSARSVEQYLDENPY